MFSPTFVGGDVLFLKPGAGGAADLFRAASTVRDDGNIVVGGGGGGVALSRVMAPISGGDTEASLSLEEKLRRERTRQLTTGITSFSTVAAGSGSASGSILFPQGGQVLWVRSGATAASVVVAKGAAGAVLDARPSPDGSRVAFVMDGELFVAPLEDGGGSRAVQVSTGARESGWCNGLADYLAQEEFDRQQGFWWSPDGGHLAYQQTDDIHVPELRIIHAGAEPASSTSLESHRYPFAGASNPVVRLAIVDVGEPALAGLPLAVQRGGPVTHHNPTLSIGATVVPPTAWLNLGADTDVYVTRVQWAGPLLFVQLLNREQTVVDVVAYSPRAPGSGLLLLREVVDDPVKGWLNVHDCLTMLGGEAAAGTTSTTTKPPRHLQFLWASERTGFSHLYLYSAKLPAEHEWVGACGSYAGPPASGVAAATLLAGGGNTAAATGCASLLCAVTTGAWVVESVAAVVPSASSVPAASPSGDGGGNASSSSAASPASSTSTYTVFCSGTKDSPLQRHVYAVPLLLTNEGPSAVAGEPVRVTTGPGMHTVVMSTDGTMLADTLSTLSRPVSLSLWRVECGVEVSAAATTGAVGAAEGGSSSATAPAAAAEGDGGGTGLQLTPVTAGAALSPPPAAPQLSMSDFVSGVSSVLDAVVRFGGVGQYGAPVDEVGGDLRGKAASPSFSSSLRVTARVSARLLSVLHGSLPPSGPDAAEEPASYGRHVAALHAIARARAGRSVGGGGSSSRGGGRAVGAPAATAAAGAFTPVVAAQHLHPQQSQPRPSSTSSAAPPPSSAASSSSLPPSLSSAAAAASSSLRPMGQLLRGTFASMTASVTEAARGVAKEVGSSLSDAMDAAFSGLATPAATATAIAAPAAATAGVAGAGADAPGGGHEQARAREGSRSGRAASLLPSVPSTSGATVVAATEAAPSATAGLSDGAAPPPPLGGDAAVPDTSSPIIPPVVPISTLVGVDADSACSSPSAATPVPGVPMVVLLPAVAGGGGGGGEEEGVTVSNGGSKEEVSAASVARTAPAVSPDAGAAARSPTASTNGGATTSTTTGRVSAAAAATATAASLLPTPPLIVSLPAADGVTELYGALFLPDSVEHGTGPYPTIMR